MQPATLHRAAMIAPCDRAQTLALPANVIALRCKPQLLACINRVADPSPPSFLTSLVASHQSETDYQRCIEAHVNRPYCICAHSAWQYVCAVLSNAAEPQHLHQMTGQVELKSLGWHVSMTIAVHFASVSLHICSNARQCFNQIATHSTPGVLSSSDFTSTLGTVVSGLSHGRCRHCP
jgi:hypothetical protein